MKRTSPWYKRYSQDFHDGTRELTLEERGAYNDILDLIYIFDRPLPDEPGRIAHYLHCTTQKWVAIRKVLLAKGKLMLTDRGLTNPRTERELEARSERRQQATLIATKRESDKRSARKSACKINGATAQAVPQNEHYAHAREISDHQRTESEEREAAALEPEAARAIGGFDHGVFDDDDQYPNATASPGRQQARLSKGEAAASNAHVGTVSQAARKEAQQLYGLSPEEVNRGADEFRELCLRNGKIPTSLDAAFLAGLRRLFASQTRRAGTQLTQAEWGAVYDMAGRDELGRVETTLPSKLSSIVDWRTPAARRKSA